MSENSPIDWKEALLEGQEIIANGVIIKIDDPKVPQLLELIELYKGATADFFEFRNEASKTFRWSPAMQKKLTECFNVKRVENTGLLISMGHDLAKTGKLFITEDEVWFVMSPRYKPEESDYHRYVRAYVGTFGDRTIAMKVLNKIIK